MAKKVHDKIEHTDESLLNKKILYIHPIHGGTYKVISKGIIEELKNSVREVYEANPHQDIVDLSTKIKPDLVLVLLGDSLSVEHVKTLKKMGINTAVWFTDDPYITDITQHIAPHYQYVFTQELSCISFYQSLGCANVHYLPLAANTKYFNYQKIDTPNQIDVCFLGMAWNNRISFFDQLAPYLAKKNTLIVGWFWERLKHYHMLADKICHKVLSPEESSRLMNQSKIVINNHRSFNDSTLFSKNSHLLPSLSINPRTFEIAACGAFQITDVRQELHRYFEAGKEIETYTTPEELMEKIEYYLNHEKEREAIAQRGYMKTIKNHTYANRMETLLKIIFGAPNSSFKSVPN